jgi:hypothetical protein
MDKLDFDIQVARASLSIAQSELVRALQAQYTVGCTYLYTRSPRVAAQMVVILSYGAGTSARVRNELTGRAYRIDLNSPRLRVAAVVK